MDKYISVIIPTIGRDTLARAIDSTSLPMIYTIVMGATEEEDILKRHISLTNLRNIGVEIANTPWVTFLDDDDYWEEDHGNTLFKLTQELSSDIGLIITLPKGLDLFSDTKHMTRYILQGEGIPSPSITIRRDIFKLVGGFPVDIPHSSHWALVAKCLALYGHKVAHLNTCKTWVYTCNSNGLAQCLAKTQSLNIMRDRQKWLNQFA